MFDEISIECVNKCTPVKFVLVDVYPLFVLALLHVCACVHVRI